MLRSSYGLVLFLFMAASVTVGFGGAAAVGVTVPVGAKVVLEVSLMSLRQPRTPIGQYFDDMQQSLNQEVEATCATWRQLSGIADREIDSVLNKCRMGMFGSSGTRLVCGVDLIVQLQRAGLSRVGGRMFGPVKNWRFPAGNFEFQRQPLMVKGERKRRQFGDLKTAVSLLAPFADAVGGKLDAAREVCIRQQHRLATLTKRKATEIGLAVARPVWPIFRIAGGGVQHLLTAMRKTSGPVTGPIHTAIHTLIRTARAELNESRLDVYWKCYSACDRWQVLLVAPAPSAREHAGDRSDGRTAGADSFGGALAVFGGYWDHLSRSAGAKLNWLTSNVRQWVEACLESLGPQFLIAEPHA